MERYQLDWLFDMAARLEQEIGELYHMLAHLFKDDARACQFFHLLGYEEGTHRNMLQLMAHHADRQAFPAEQFEAAVTRLQTALDEVVEMQREMAAHPMSLMQALQLASRLERSEADSLVHSRLGMPVPEEVGNLVAYSTAGTREHAERVASYLKDLEQQPAMAG